MGKVAVLRATLASIFIVYALTLPFTTDALRFKRQEDGEPVGEPPEPPAPPAAATAEDTPTESDAVAVDPGAGPSQEVTIKAPDTWILDSIRQMNKIRGNHEACPLSFDRSLCSAAQTRANEIITSGEIQAIEGDAENVYAAKMPGAEDVPYPEDPPNGWYEERLKYDYETGKPKADGDTVDFFTQLVWKDSVKVCITYDKAAEKDENGEYLSIVVAKFSPGGNVADQFGANVRPELIATDPAPVSTKIDSDKCPKAKAEASAEWLQNVLDVHNLLRALHGSVPLILNNDLSEISQAWANKMADTNSFEHNSDCNAAAQLGENLYYSSGESPSDEPANGTRAVVAWYEEIENYDYEKSDSTNGMEILHFTQLVWRETREMGGAYATSKKPNSRGLYSTYVVVNYVPRGNFGDFIENVKPPTCKNLNYADIGLPVSGGGGAGGGGGGGGSPGDGDGGGGHGGGGGGDAPPGPTDSNGWSSVSLNQVLITLAWIAITCLLIVCLLAICVSCWLTVCHKPINS